MPSDRFSDFKRLTRFLTILPGEPCNSRSAPSQTREPRDLRYCTSRLVVGVVGVQSRFLGSPTPQRKACVRVNGGPVRVASLPAVCGRFGESASRSAAAKTMHGLGVNVVIDRKYRTTAPVRARSYYVDSG
eukprot:844267-Prorocentrum_minimum.AAC.5